MKSCGNTFAGGVTDGKEYALVCGTDGQQCNACLMQDADAMRAAAESETIVIRGDETIEPAVDAQVT